MRTTVTLDDDLVARAKFLTGQQKLRELINEGLAALVERESARRLARLGGTEKDLVLPPRRRESL